MKQLLVCWFTTWQIICVYIYRSTKVWPSEVERRKGNDGDNAALQTGEKGGHHIWVCIF